MECILNVESWDSLIHIVSCILEDIASSVVDVRLMIRNKCPWALYVSKKTGRRWATFIARSKFQGYHFKFEGDRVTCTNLATGKQYEVSLTSCTCETFAHSQPDSSGKKPACEHIQQLQQLGDELAAKAASPQPSDRISLDRDDCPHGFRLLATDNSKVREHEVFTAALPREAQKPLYIGRIREKLDGSCIIAHTPRSFIGREFPTTGDAIRFLARYAGIKTAQPA